MLTHTNIFYAPKFPDTMLTHTNICYALKFPKEELFMIHNGVSDNYLSYFLSLYKKIQNILSQEIYILLI